MTDFQFLFALYEGGSGNPANPNDCMNYAQQVGITTFPVMADGARALANATPMTQNVHPEMCAIGPDFTILECFAGHGGYNDALDAIRAHMAQQ